MALRRKQADPGRDLLNIIHEIGKDATIQHAPRLETGEVVAIEDDQDGIVVDVDNMTTMATDCICVNGLDLSLGDRVILFWALEEFYIIGTINNPGLLTSPDSGPLVATVIAGVPDDGDFAITPQNGTLAVDSVSNKLYVRIGGLWKGVTVS